MRIIKLAIAAAFAFGAPSIASAASPTTAIVGAAAVTAATCEVAPAKASPADKFQRHHRRGRWVTRRVCRTVWRNHHRQRVCRVIRMRRR